MWSGYIVQYKLSEQRQLASIWSWGSAWMGRILDVRPVGLIHTGERLEEAGWLDRQPADECLAASTQCRN